MITEKIYMMVSVANYELNDDDREKMASFFWSIISSSASIMWSSQLRFL